MSRSKMSVVLRESPMKYLDKSRDSSKFGNRLSLADNLENIQTNMEKVVKKVKPWEKRKKLTSGDSTFQYKLPSIEDYKDNVEFMSYSHPRVVLRLERVMGTSQVRLNDTVYMENLCARIEEEEEIVWEKRINKRNMEGTELFRKLAIEGVIEPEPGMEDIYTHPLYRSNRIMKHLNEMNLKEQIPIAPKKYPLTIDTVEPFTEYEKTGLLFSKHKHHYLKISPVSHIRHPPVSTVKVSESGTMSVQIIPRSEKKSTVDKEWGGEDYNSSSLSPSSSPSSKDDLDPFVNLRNCLGRGTLSLATRFLDLQENELEKRFKVEPSKFVNDFFQITESSRAEDLYHAGNGVNHAYKRENLKTKEFCARVHRKLFTN